LNPGKSNQTPETVEEQFAAPETDGISWSADGRYLVFAFPKRAIINMISTSNIWLADLTTGAVDPLFELPERFRIWDDDAPDVPYRARFDDREPWLYYELSISNDRYRAQRFYRWDYLTDETVYLGEVPVTLMTADPVMLRAGDHLITTAVSTRIADGAGLAAMTVRTEGIVLSDAVRQWISGLAYGKGAAFSLVKVPPLLFYLHGARLLGVRESDAPEGSSELLLLCNPFFHSDDPTDFLTAHMHLLEGSLNSNGRARYGAFLAADVTAPPASRLMRVPPAAPKEGAEAETAYQRLIDGEIAPFHNAAYAPDGGFLLLAARFAGMPGQRLYAVNRATGECGLVTQPEDLAGVTLAFIYETPINRFSAGITWSAGDLLLVNAGTVNRLYQLTMLTGD
jgi:hypothetical protein